MNQYQILKYFKYDHLPEKLQKISKPFHDQAQAMAKIETDNPAEIAAGLRKLLEAKDCAVRAAL